MMSSANRRPLMAAGTCLGIGMGGFVDGIVFHQILQWHNMLSAVRPPSTLVNVEINMFWDGLFHAFTWSMTALGITLLWRAIAPRETFRSARTLAGALSLGFGLFNLVEGVIDHHLLGIHHVIETPGHLGYDLAFLASGAALILVGWGLIATDRSATSPAAS